MIESVALGTALLVDRLALVKVYHPTASVARFVLPSEVSLLYAVCVSLGKVLDHALAGSVVALLTLTKLMSPTSCISFRWLVSFGE